MKWCRSEPGRLVLELHVQPGASRTEVVGLHGERLKLRIGAPAVDGNANAALIDFLAARFGVARRAVTLEAGASARRKRVSIAGAGLRPDDLLPPA